MQHNEKADTKNDINGMFFDQRIELGDETGDDDD